MKLHQKNFIPRIFQDRKRRKIGALEMKISIESSVEPNLVHF